MCTGALLGCWWWYGHCRKGSKIEEGKRGKEEEKGKNRIAKLLAILDSKIEN